MVYNNGRNGQLSESQRLLVKFVLGLPLSLCKKKNKTMDNFLNNYWNPFGTMKGNSFRIKKSATVV